MKQLPRERQLPDMEDKTMEKNTIIWRSIPIEITYTPELRTEDKTPLPVTETGYRSHFMNKGAVAHNGGAVAFVTAWLDHKAEQTKWNNAQLSLF